LLLDEAASRLDAVNEAALRDTIAEAARVTTVRQSRTCACRESRPCP
jgi:ABC-type multidrug transport system fused ATPase/permease subunit